MGTHVSPESLLFEAILFEDVGRVRRLIHSGLDKNGLLHCPQRWEGASVLGTAAFLGSLPVLRVLLEAGVEINFQDPCGGRSALHWAVMGGKVEVVDFLLQHGADPNSMDRDSATPLILAAAKKEAGMVRPLVAGGARVDHADRLRSSALHYATASGDSRTTRELVRAGCLANHASIFGSGTPLANLLRHKDADNVRLLLEAGYDVSNEAWRGGEVPAYVDTGSQAWSSVLLTLHSPPRLKSLCRRAIRDCVHPPLLEESIRKLPVPSRVASFLLLDEA